MTGLTAEISNSVGPIRKKVSVVVAVYYNEESLPHLFRELLDVEAALSSRDLDLELIFVDDGSGDHSLGELLKIKQQRPATKVIKLTRNFGAVHASKTGAQFVTGGCYMVLAADLQDPPELILQMVDQWLDGNKYVVCARQDRDDPLLTKLFAWFYYQLTWLLVFRDYPRHGYDLALMDRAFLPYMQNSSKNLNPLIFSYWLGFAPKMIYYKRRVRVFGKSRWTFAKKATFFLDSLLGFSIIPIRIMSTTGITVSLLSFVYGGWIGVSAILGRTEVRGFATIVALISFLLGIVMIMLGVIGEYTWRIFDELNKRPESVIDEIY
jgi:glycosyltransferase involved in cell wall biosynthesis